MYKQFCLVILVGVLSTNLTASPNQKESGFRWLQKSITTLIIGLSAPVALQLFITPSVLANPNAFTAREMMLLKGATTMSGGEDQGTDAEWDEIFRKLELQQQNSQETELLEETEVEQTEDVQSHIETNQIQTLNPRPMIL